MLRTEYPKAFFHGGLGGSLAFSDLNSNFSFAYVTNGLVIDTDEEDPRRWDLINSLYSCLPSSLPSKL